MARVRGRTAALALAAVAAFSARGAAAQGIKGRVMNGGAPIAKSVVTLWEAGTGTPKKLAQAVSNDAGAFELRSRAPRNDGVLYVMATGGEPRVGAATGDNPAIVLMVALGARPPATVVINELTTIASVWTHAQFLDGNFLSGNALGLRIAAGNVPNFVDLTTGTWGDAIQGPLNGPQTTTMANLATLADLLAACVSRVTGDACAELFAVASPPLGLLPTDTLSAAEAIARYPWRAPGRLFALLQRFYQVPKGKNLLAVPYMPYLSFAPSAWVLPLKFDGGGYRAGGKAMFDSEGNLWVGSNFTVGWQGQDNLWQGNVAKFAPNGRPLSPMTTGFAGGGFEGGTFGAAVDAKDNVWLTSYGGKSISLFDKRGNPLSPADGITFDGRLGLMQGVIVAPNEDVWVLGISKNQVVYFPKGDQSQGRLLCEGTIGAPCSSLLAPFHLGIDQQDRIWVTNAGADFVTRFPAGDPTQVETFKTGYSGSGLGIDSRGNVWVTNRFGNGPHGKATLDQVVKAMKSGGNFDEVLTRAMSKQVGGPDGGSVTLLRPDGTQAPGSPFSGASLPGPWAVAVDGDDTVWISNFAGPAGQIAHLCGAQPEACLPGMKTGDPISPPLGYVGGGLQMQTDLAIDPAGNVWVMNNWQDINSCFGTPPEALSTRCGGQGVTVFYGMARPVRAPQIGPARPVEASRLQKGARQRGADNGGAAAKRRGLATAPAPAAGH
jgi:hypothetical protein